MKVAFYFRTSNVAWRFSSFFFLYLFSLVENHWPMITQCWWVHSSTSVTETFCSQIGSHSVNDHKHDHTPIAVVLSSFFNSVIFLLSVKYWCQIWLVLFALNNYAVHLRYLKKNIWFGSTFVLSLFPLVSFKLCSLMKSQENGTKQWGTSWSDWEGKIYTFLSLLWNEYIWLSGFKTRWICLF